MNTNSTADQLAEMPHPPLSDNMQRIVFQALSVLLQLKIDALKTANAHLSGRGAFGFSANDFGIPDIRLAMNELCPSFFDDEGE